AATEAEVAHAHWLPGISSRPPGSGRRAHHAARCGRARLPAVGAHRGFAWARTAGLRCSDRPWRNRRLAGARNHPPRAHPVVQQLLRRIPRRPGARAGPAPRTVTPLADRPVNIVGAGLAGALLAVLL